MRWLARLGGGDPGPKPERPHDALDLEAKMPKLVANRELVTWSVAGASFWQVVATPAARGALGPELESVGIPPDSLAMAVAGRADLRDPPYIVWALRFGTLRAIDLPTPATALAMEVMHVDANQGEDWRPAVIADKEALVGNPLMVRQDRHQRGMPYVYLGAEAIYCLITDDEAWAIDVVRQFPAS